MIYVKAVALFHCSNGDYCMDFRGIQEDCIKDFLKWCEKKQEILWAKLFVMSTSEELAKYRKEV